MRSFLLVVALSALAAAQKPSQVWVADNGDGTYKNPVLHADYSDPDVVRVGADFYLTASSFNSAPGLPILHSRDLVNWEIIAHVYAAQPPLNVFNKVINGGGAWAPSIRYHAGSFYIFYPDPDLGIYMVKAKDAAGPWSAPLLIKSAPGWIDPCPLWDDDGKAYLVSALAGSRSGMKSQLIVSRMDPGGTRLLDDGVLVFDGHAEDPTVEGPKFYKRNGYYYIMAPAGGVEGGWQLVLRSRNVYGPYERRVTLAQGSTPVNGPHQGAWIDTSMGESWFLHFQDAGAYGRIVHLQPVKWVADWPVMGDDGYPVLTHKKPNVGKTYPITSPVESDEFGAPRIGLQWQWAANPQPGWAFPSVALGVLRLFAVALPEGIKNFWDVPNLLLQKFPAPQFTATTKVTFTPRANEEQTGLIVTGADYAYIALKKKADGLYISQTICKRADRGSPELESRAILVQGTTFYLRVSVEEKALCRFSYSVDGASFTAMSEPFTAVKGRWIGSRVGLFAVRPGKVTENGYADYDWFRITR